MNKTKANLKPNTCITYLGKSDDEITGQLIEVAQSYLQNIEEPGKLSKRVPFLIAESYQNVIRHGDKNNAETGQDVVSDFFQINFFSDRVVICAVNKIKKEHINSLDEKIDQINTLDKDGLKNIWRASLAKNQLSDKGGAGLGLIEMARKSEMPIQKCFIDLDEEMGLFFSGIEILHETDSSESNFEISTTVGQYTKFIETGVILEYIGPFNNDTNMPLIEMMENNLIKNDGIDSNSAENLSVIIEIMQNVSKHALLLKDLKEGAFTIYKNNEQLYISCSNYISQASFNSFSFILNKIKSKTITELKAQRNDQLLNEDLSEDGNGGLGILEIALFTANAFEYTFVKIPNEDYYYYTIKVKLK